MSEFNWQDNSKEMYEALVKQPPLPLRPMVKKALTKALSESCADGAVTPAELVKAVRKSTPPPFVAGALKSVESMYKCPSKCAECKDGCPLAP